MGSAFNLGKVFGIQFRLHYTWFIIFILLVVALSRQAFPNFYPGWTPAIYWLMGIVTSLLFFISLIAHELAHSLVARIYGIPVKSITLFIFGGIAQISKEATKAGAEFRMAIAGPACSLAISGLFYLLGLLTTGRIVPLAAMAIWLAQINALLAAFNLIPGFPLDGGRVFRSILWRFTSNYMRSTRIATRVGQGVGYLFILGGIIIMFFFHQWFNGLWLAFIGWFLGNAASASYRQAGRREALQGFTASQIMTSNCPLVPPDITLNQLVQEYIYPSRHRSFLIADGGKLKGIVTLHDIKSASQQNRGMTQVKEIMTPVDKLKVAHPDQDALSILEQMDENNVNQMPVVKEGRVIGLVVRDNLVGFLRIRSELGI